MFLILLQVFSWIRQNCIPTVRMHLEEKFFWKVFFVTFGHWNKSLWYFVEDFRAGLSNCILRVQWNFLREKTFFREKKQFLLSCSDTDPILFRSFVNIFSAGSSKLNHKCPIAIPGKNFFEKFLVSFGAWANVFQFSFEKNSIVVSKSSFYVPTWSFWGRFFWKLFFFLNLFGKRAKFCRPNANNFPQGVQTAFCVTTGTVWRSFFFEKFLFLIFYRFLTFSDNIPAFCRIFFVTAVRTAFWLSKGTFWGYCFLETFFPFVQWAKDFGLSSQKVFAHSSKWHSRRSEAQFGEKCFLFWKKTVFFSNASVPR